MAVEARHVNPFPPKFLNDRANLINGGIYSNNNNNNSIQMGFADHPLPSAFPSSDQSLIPFYQSTKSTYNNDDSDVTYNPSFSRKRSRDEFNHPLSAKFSSSPFLDLQLLMENQQSEIGFLITQHTEKVRMELEEQMRRQMKVFYSIIQEATMKKVKEKEEEIQKIGKMNWALQEKVKSLAQENQILMQLAQTNEATANSLRTNLEQLLSAVEVAQLNVGGHLHTAAAAEEVDDAESSCGSNDDCEVPHLPEKRSDRLCRMCGVRESIVLLLPCRHLSLCTMCGSSCHNCPFCHSRIDGSVHVNFS